jgi:hypothetical protein
MYQLALGYVLVRQAKLRLGRPIDLGRAKLPLSGNDMVNLPGRDRRRRVLKDGVLSASSNYATLRAANDDTHANDAPRYSDAAGVENHPQITDFVPRSYSTIAMLVGGGLGLTAALGAAQMFVAPVLNARGIRGAEAFNLSATGSIATWSAAIVTLVASAVCLLIYSIRRHRINDFRGRYRVWLGAAMACVLLSVNCVAGLHQLAADAFAQLTGWSALRDGAAWWLMLAGLPLGWITLRALLDMRECRFAAGIFVAAVACYCVSAVNYLGFIRIADPHAAAITSGATLLMGHWLVLAAAVSYARFVILDAQGLIAIRRQATVVKSAKRPEAKAASEPSSIVDKKAAAAAVSSGSYSRPTTPIQTVKTPADSSRWVDGSRPERKRYEDDADDDDTSEGGGKLSKADRKRLRKLKTEGRAA